MLQRIPTLLARSRIASSSASTTPRRSIKPVVRSFHCVRSGKTDPKRKGRDRHHFKLQYELPPHLNWVNDFLTPDYKIDSWRWPNEDGAESNARSPPMDIIKTPKGFNVSVELAGIRKEDIKLSVDDDNVLLIKGEPQKKANKEENDENEIVKSERYTGKFARAAQLPPKADLSNITAKYENGILDIDIPNKGDAKEIKIGVV
mmetsp:Transcript_30981/g.34555  ORF Transcript_30981/g.34555 Transcript_30981/m.34555 type:complete len:203 (+) Transcript_30981:24-632(+)